MKSIFDEISDSAGFNHPFWSDGNPSFWCFTEYPDKKD